MFLDALRSVIFGMCMAIPVGPIMYAAMLHMRNGSRRNAHALAYGSVMVDSVWVALGVGVLLGIGSAHAIYGVVLAHRRVSIILGALVMIAFGAYFAIACRSVGDDTRPRGFWTSFWVAAQNPVKMFMVVLLTETVGIHIRTVLSGGVILAGLITGDCIGWFGSIHIFAKIIPERIFLKLTAYIGIAYILAGCAIVLFNIFPR